jgi:exodeoxyribonuclease V gamma subunit
VSVQHPLQAFSPRYRDGADPRLFTYAGAEAPPRHPAGPFVTAGIAPAEPRPQRIELDELIAFWRNPARWWLRNVLQVRLAERSDRDFDAEPFVVHGLDKWRLQDLAARHSLQGAPPSRDPLARARADGILPAGEVGRIAFTVVTEETELFLARVRPHVATGRKAIQVRGPDFEVHAEFDNLGAEEQVLWRITKQRQKDVLRAFLRHALLCAARAQGAAVPTTTRVISKDKTLRFVPMADAVEYLATAVRGLREGRAAPVPFFEYSSHEYARRLHKGGDEAAALVAARAKWIERDGIDDGRWVPPGDCEDPWNELCWRDRDPLAERAFAGWAAAIWGPALSWSEEGA